MRRFGVSRPSAVRSIAELKRLGLVTARKGAGTFVSQKNRTIGLAIPGTADSEFFSAIMDGLVFNCNKYGMDLVAGDIFAVDHDKRARQAERLARHFASIGVAGWLVKTLKKLGVAVPDDVMIAGFDDVREAAGMNPPLTSVRQPCFEIANMAFKALLERMANAKLPPREILLDTTLVVRKSTTPSR